MKYVVLLMIFFCVACAKPVPQQAVSPAATLAVAHFIHPEQDWELMAGVLPEDPAAIAPEALGALDIQLVDTLGRLGSRTVLRPTQVRQCEENVTTDKERRRFEAVEYWKAVGQCVQADYLLVPFVSRWQERDGGEWGVTRPASLTLDLYLIETKSGQTRRYHFEEEQRGLAENLLQGRRFVQRKGRWVTPQEIAAEAIEEGVRMLGL
jgi:hypothetical protein